MRWKPKIAGSMAALLTILFAFAATAGCERGAFGYYGERAVLDVTVMRGPIDPAGGGDGEDEEPVEGARVVAHPFSGDFTRNGMTDRAGNIRFQVAPGRWQIFVEECPGAIHLPDERTVTVQPGGETSVRFTCDTGIR